MVIDFSWFHLFLFSIIDLFRCSNFVWYLFSSDNVIIISIYYWCDISNLYNRILCLKRLLIIGGDFRGIVEDLLLVRSISIVTKDSLPFRSSRQHFSKHYGLTLSNPQDILLFVLQVMVFVHNHVNLVYDLLIMSHHFD